jgi:sugar/nucleoside kinase (ribokinase family)
VVVCTLGDLLLDVIVQLAEPLRRGDDARARTRTGAGGQAANVAAWAAALGAEARFVGKRGDDEAGALVAGELSRHGVEVLGPVVAGRTGVVVSLVEPGGERSLASDRGVAPELAPDELDPEWFDGCDVLHVPGYSLAVSPIAEAAAHAAALVPRVSVDVSAASVVDAALRERLAALEPEIVFAGEAELDALGEVAAPTVVHKRGAGGFEVGGRTYAPRAADAVDTTGAGDALAAGFLVGGPELAVEAAARCVARPGAMP